MESTWLVVNTRPCIQSLAQSTEIKTAFNLYLQLIFTYMKANLVLKNKTTGF